MLTLGTAQFGQRYGTGAAPDAPSRREVADILHAAQSGGIGWLDTARAYGGSEAEIGAIRSAGIGSAMRLVTKVRPLGQVIAGGQGTADGEAGRRQVIAAVRASVRESLEALRADALDVLLLHRAADAFAASGAAVDALRDLLADGVIRAWGVSVSTPDELVAALALPGLSHVQLPFNLLDRRWLAPQVQSALAASPGVHVTARSVLLQGLLAADDPARWPAVPGIDPAATGQALGRLARDLGRASVLDLCVAYVSASDWIGSVVFGTRRVSQLLSFLAAAARPALAPDDAAHVHRTLPPGPDALVNPALWPARPLMKEVCP